MKSNLTLTILIITLSFLSSTLVGKTAYFYAWYYVAHYCSGYGTYKFTVDAASTKVVNKEFYWTAVSAYGEEKRVALQHSLNYNGKP